MYLRVIFILSLSFLATSCSPWVANSIEQQCFEWFGKSFFTRSEKLSIHQAIMGQKKYGGQQVSIEGEVVEMGDFSTFLIIKGKNGTKLLVVMAGVPERGLVRLGDHALFSGTLLTKKWGAPSLEARLFKVKS